MRIIAGLYRGRHIDAPKGLSTRPTTDRVRESLFSSLSSMAGPDMGAGAVLDAFAGSGALGLEALSRGAVRATLVEHDRGAVRTLRSNVTGLGVEDRVSIVAGDVFSLAGRLAGGPFALILMDPPYTLDVGRISSWLASISDAGHVAEDALVTWEHSASVRIEWPQRYESVASKRYGSTAIDIARFSREAGEK